MTMTMTDTDTVDISLTQTRTPERTFIGKIVIDKIEPAKAFEGEVGPQYQEHLAVEPLSFKLNKEGSALHCWPRIKYKDGKLVTQGEFGRVTSSIREVFKAELTKRGMELRKEAVLEATTAGQDTTELVKRNPLDFVKVGQGHFLGLTGEFAMRTLEYGKNKAGETMRGGRESIVAVKLVKAEDLAAAQASLTGVPVHADLEYTEGQVEALLTHMDGKTPEQYMKGIGRSGLPGEVINAVTNGRGLSFLQEKGLATVDADGRVTRA